MMKYRSRKASHPNGDVSGPGTPGDDRGQLRKRNLENAFFWASVSLWLDG